MALWKVSTFLFALQVAILTLGKLSEQEQQKHILHFLSCVLKVPLKCSSVTYLAIVLNNILRSELLTTSE